MDSKREQGFTLVELMVGILLFAIVSVAFYQVLFATARSSDTARAVTKVSEEARLGFGRMIRDTREGRVLLQASPTAYKVEVDFDGDGAIATEGNTNSQGDFEILTYAFNSGTNTVTLNGEVLMRHVECITDPCDPVNRPFFRYSSNHLEYDWSSPPDGIVTWEELDKAPNHGVVGVGNNNGLLDMAELPFVSNVSYELKVVERDSFTEFSAEAQLRNLR